MKFFIGVASGSQLSALKKSCYPYVMISYATKNNRPWRGIKELFIDSGGYSFFHGKGEYTTSDKNYIQYIIKWKPKYFALRDYPSEPEILVKWGRTIEENQQKTLERHLNLLDLIDEYGIWKYSEPVAVLQGWALKDYLRHYDMMKEHGVFTKIDYVAIGTLCRRRQEATIRKIITGIREALPRKFRLHGFGVKISALKYKDIYDALYSADNCAWGFSERLSGNNKVESQYKALLKFIKKLEMIKQMHESQSELERFFGEDTLIT